VAAVAISIGGSQIVIAADVALRACADFSGRSELVRTGERPAGGAVIESCGVPSRGGVASCAIGSGERGASGRVRRIICLLPGREVAARNTAIRGGNGEVVIIADVAGGAGNVGVALGQKKAGDAVVEGGGGPADSVVAIGAVGHGKRGTGRRVHGIIGLLPGGEVAAGVAAIRGRDGQVVVVVDVAGSAGNVGMAVGQRESGGAVIEFCAQPGVE
jgi:hypothetical protein